jgi:ArsR family transcriptional regulator
MLVNTMLVVTMGVDEPHRGDPMTDPGFACCTPLSGASMSTEQAEQVAPLLKALADPVRLRLVSLIAASAGGEACVCDLNAAFELTQATISHHLKVLHSAGLLDRDKRGVWVYYAVRPAALAAVANLFDTATLQPA